MGSTGTVDFDGFYGSYRYELRSGSRECNGVIELMQYGEETQQHYDQHSDDHSFVIKCNWKGHMHVPVWATPAIIAFLFVGCLLGCYQKNTEQLMGQRLQRQREADIAARTPWTVDSKFTPPPPRLVVQT